MANHQFQSTLKNIGLFNLIALIVIALFEAVSIFVEIPVLFVSEGDAAGISEFSGTWFDHLIKVLIALTLILALLSGVKQINSSDRQVMLKSSAMIMGSSAIILVIGILYGLIWLSSLLDAIILSSFSEWAEVWYLTLRIEMILALINIPIVKNWTKIQELDAQAMS